MEFALAEMPASIGKSTHFGAKGQKGETFLKGIFEGEAEDYPADGLPKKAGGKPTSRFYCHRANSGKLFLSLPSLKCPSVLGKVPILGRKGKLGEHF